MSYDKYQVKEALSIEDIYDILFSLGAEPEMCGDYIVSRTICHNGEHEGSRKLFYYDSTQLFRCYTNCGTFDIFELLQKVKNLSLNDAIYYVVNFFNLQWKIQEIDDTDIIEDMNMVKHWQDLADIKINHEKVELPVISKDVLKYYPKPRIKNWEQDHITKDVCDYMGICYDPVTGGILIPHTDEQGNLIGIRRRTLIKDEEQYGKYRPWVCDGKMYNHPLGFNLYGYAQAKDNIARMRKAIIFEAEKSVLQSIEYLGLANDICVAVCGSYLTKYQLQMLLRAGANEIVVAFDADFDKVGDEKYYETIKKLKKVSEQYNGRAVFSYMFDRTGKLVHSKMSPSDGGKDIFMKLWRERFTVNG